MSDEPKNCNETGEKTSHNSSEQVKNLMWSQEMLVSNLTIISLKSYIIILVLHYKNKLKYLIK